MKAINYIIMVTLMTIGLTSCANVFGRTTLMYIEKTNSESTAKVDEVVFFSTKEVDPTNTVPSELKYRVLAKVAVKGKVPIRNPDNSFVAPLSNKSYYKSESLRTHVALAERLEDEAKQIGADIVIITEVGSRREQRVDSVSYNGTSNVSIGPWFDVPVLKATLAHSRP